jgi:hypothetical protein
MNITVTTVGHVRNIRFMPSPIQVAQRVDRIAVMDRHVASVIHNEHVFGWQHLSARYDEIAGVMNFATNETGTFAAIWSWAPAQTVANDPIHVAMLFVNSQIRIRMWNAIPRMHSPTPTILTT